MADLKANSTVGGAPIWHKGNFPLSPVGDTLLFKTYKVYTEKDKPQATDNDFVSKALGGEYLKNVNYKEGLSFNDKEGNPVILGVPKSTSPDITYKASLKVTGPFALETPDNVPFVIFDPTVQAGVYRLIVMGDVLGQNVYDSTGRVFSPGNTPSKAQVGLGLVDNAKQVQLNNTALQEMTGNLSAPNFFSRNPASDPAHVPRFDQIVIKDSIQDFGEF
jgi:hypothetical protein